MPTLPLRRRTAAAIAALTATAGLAACSSSASGGAAGEDARSKPIDDKTAYLISCFDANAWCKAFNARYMESLEDAGIEVTLLQNGFDPVEEAQQFDQAISQRPGAIAVFAADGNAVVPSIKRAVAANIPVINLVAPVSEEVRGDLALNLVEDAATNGRTLAEHVMGLLEDRGMDKARILILNGVATQYQMIAQWDAFEEELSAKPGLEVVEKVDAQYDQAKAETLATQLFAKWQSRGGIDVVVAANDAMLAGGIEAGQKLGLDMGGEDGILTVSGGCFPVGHDNIEAGTQVASSTVTPVPEADLYAPATIDLFNGETTTDEVLFQSEIIDASNLDTVGQSCLY